MAISVDERLAKLGRPMISTRSVRVENKGAGIAKFRLSVEVFDSVGTPLLRSTLPDDGSDLRLPPAQSGGLDGYAVMLGANKGLANVLDSLVAADVRFGMRVTIDPSGKDSNLANNVGTREWGEWIPLGNFGLPIVSEIAFATDAHARVKTITTVAPRVPTDVVVETVDLAALNWEPDRLHQQELRITPPAGLPHGVIFAVKVSVVDGTDRRLFQQRERIFVNDTLPPVIVSYRAILAEDGRFAIQAYVTDRHAGVEEGGVRTLYSSDHGATWNHQSHRVTEDDFGRASVFETVIGPFLPGTDLLLRIDARDLVGNRTTCLPSATGIWTAPRGLDLSLFGMGTIPGGSPVFMHEEVLRIGSLMDVERSLEEMHFDRAEISIGDLFDERRRGALREVRKLLSESPSDGFKLRDVGITTQRLASASGMSSCGSISVPAWR